ncbi:P-loop containing nucleoside triphosphate hydrolase protein [Geranomyces variabilis]|nr:P-loop containing nucleoside triphosphate hydrolase protein [Geranomyces variabilis]KAJ3132022.1 Multidrug resistance-associated protein 1 [Geranomyces variabilis]
MNKVSGNVEINGSVLYVAQTPWLFNASVRDNILLGAAYDETWYNTVVEACALEADYQTLPAGDRTEIGGRGVNLSGGQRQRISLACAVYARANVYLIDDTLSAVDARVGRHIFDRVLGPEGLLRGTTRLFVTHSVQYLDAMDRILVMDDGRVVEDGVFEVLRSNGQKLAEIIATMEGQQHRRASSVSEDSKHTSADRSEELNKAEDDVDSRVTAVSDPSEETGLLIQKEVNETGHVGLRHFAFYIRACSWPLFLIFLSSVAASEGINLGSRYWLLHWSNEKTDSTTLNQWSYLGVYLGWLPGYVVVYAAAAIFYLYYVSPRASAVIHDMLLLRVIRMPLSFFDTTPIGRILTRFQFNVRSVDGGLPDEFYDIAFGLASIIVSVLSHICS